MTATLFDIDDKPAHNCAGPTCSWCAWRERIAAAEAGTAAANANRDLEWAQRADAWLADCVPAMAVITSDDLIDAVGLPVGSPNQIGARFKTWQRAGFIEMTGVTTSTRRTNHGRLLREWRAIA